VPAVPSVNNVDGVEFPMPTLPPLVINA